jgi:hypothetical protein
MAAPKKPTVKAPASPAAAATPAAPATPAAQVTAAGRLEVTALTPGFRRAGRAWPAEPVTVSISEFSDAQLAALLAESNLVVSLLPGEPLAESQADKGVA